jgi:hypothetical protein
MEQKIINNWVRKGVLVLLILTIILINFYFEKEKNPLNESEKNPLDESEIYNCNYDNECVVVDGGCCGCGAGGGATAINEGYFDYWKNKLSAECKPIACITVMSNHPTCFAKPKCVMNKCILD